MGPSLRDMLAELPAERQVEIKAGAENLLEEFDTLQAVRKAVGATQAEVADAMGIKQASVSKIENQRDMKLSTLASYVQAVGGELSLTIELPDRAPVSVSYEDLINAL